MVLTRGLAGTPCRLPCSRPACRQGSCHTLGSCSNQQGMRSGKNQGVMSEGDHVGYWLILCLRVGLYGPCLGDCQMYQEQGSLPKARQAGQKSCTKHAARKDGPGGMP